MIMMLISTFISCNEYQKLLNSDDTSEKYKQAEVYYNSGEYRKANRLLEQIIPKYRGKPQAQRIIFFFADSYFQTKSYYLAAYQYESFIKSYPKSDRIQEATFKAAKSYYFSSPKYSLDQEDTYTAIEKLQVFINLYPNSEYISEANQMISELQEKLEQKDFEIAKQYFTIRDYRSAIKAFPKPEVKLQTEKGIGVFQKMDIFKGVVWYSYKNDWITWHKLTTKAANTIIQKNKAKEVVASLEEYVEEELKAAPKLFDSGVGEDSISRFDQPKQRNKKKRRNNKRKFQNGKKKAT